MRRGQSFVIVVAVALLFLPTKGEAAPACTIPGTVEADWLRGTKRADVICAKGGADKVYGLGGADIIRGGGGNDALVGGRGADRLIGGSGRDHCQDKGVNTYLRGCEPVLRKRTRPRPIRLTCCRVLPGPTDVTAPEVRGVYFTKPYVDTSSESSIRLWVDAWDSQSGVGNVEVELEGPDGPWRELAFESDPYDGTSTLVDVPSTTPVGNYRVTALSLADRVGNRVTFNTAELEGAGFDDAFDVFVGPDIEGPELTDYSFTPATVDTSAAATSVRFSFAATDDLSGVDDVAALISLPSSKPPLCFPCGHRAPSDLRSGSIYDGLWVEDLPLPQFARTGTYVVSAVVLYDRAGNRTDYHSEELEELGYPVELTQTGVGDTEPPEVVDFWMSPGTLQSSSGNGAIQFFVRVKDDLSGIGETGDSVFEELRVDFQPPHASDWWYTDGGTTQISGTELDGVWRFRKILPAEAETGTWTIPTIAATDHAGNETLLRETELKATGWDLTFENLP